MTAPTRDPEVLARALTNLRAEAAARIATVARLRAERDAADAIVQEREAAFFATIKADTDRAHDLGQAVTVAEQEARALALDLYAADPDHSKAPVPGATIRVKSGVRYSTTEATAWCREKRLFLVPEMLDTKALDKFLLNNASEITLPYDLTETPTAALATDLSFALTPTETPA